ncbi:MAG: HDIG domain-containing protein [Synergistaceae bacterium]|nr:HDIG domain-containing protein [Synergistaceae bacterium]
MTLKTKPRILLQSEKNFFQRIDFKLISQYIGPVIFLKIAGISLVLAQWVWLNRRDESFTVGQPAPETYRVVSHMRYDDQDAVKALRSMVSESVVGVAVRDVSAKSRLERWLEALNETSSSETMPPQYAAYLSRLPEALLNAIANLNNTDKSRILNLAYQTGSAYIDRLESGSVTFSSSESAGALWDEINKHVSSASDANFVYQILAGLGNLNLRIDDDLTQLAKRAAADDVPELDRRLEPGDIIVAKGEIVTPQRALLLRLQGYTEDVFPVAEIYVVIACVLALPLWLHILRHGAGERKTTWWAVVIVILTAWICEILAARLGAAGAGTLAAVTFAYLCIPDYLAFCIAFIASVSGIFIVLGLPISKLILISAMSVTSVTLGFYMLRHLESKRQVWHRVAMMSLILVCVRIFVRMVQGTISSSQIEFWQEAVIFFAFDIFSTQIILFVMTFLEEYIGVLSILTLREASYPSSPLLRDLQRNAPGTYQHCLTIATLIEAVGIKLGMDVNLLRAGAYYHDIGKLRRPHFFVENQGGGNNLHDEMSPMLSSLTIIAHVKDGLEMAWEAKLPRRIRDFIAEHHGTTCTRYFYDKALAMGEKVEREDFCYPGPAPQSRETALLMITDSVEAAVRAANVRDAQPEKIRKIIDQVVQSKINENQFDHVSFTLKDLTVIKDTLMSVLISMYHTRKVKKIEKRL